MNMKQSIKAAALAFAAGAAPIASVAASVQLDAVEIASDTNIVVETGDTLKIEYVYGDNPVTVTKSGGGRLEIATSSISNLSVVVADGTFASARPQATDARLIAAQFQIRRDWKVSDTFGILPTIF